MYCRETQQQRLGLVCAGNSTAWLFPFVDGHPPIGWEDGLRYLLLPVLLVSIVGSCISQKGIAQ